MVRIRTTFTLEWYDGKDIAESLSDLRLRLRPLTGMQKYRIENAVQPGQRLPTVDAQYDAIRDSLVDWEGMRDQHGNAVPFRSEHVDHLEPMMVLQIFLHVWQISELSEDERKNS